MIAATRNPGGSTGLQNLAAQVSADRLALVTLDLAESSSIRRAVEEASRLLPHGLDYLVNNAAVILQSSAVRTFEEMYVCPFLIIHPSCLMGSRRDLELFEKELRINTIAPLELARFLLPLVRASKEKKVIFITSDGGSIQLAPQWPTLIVTYSVTKAGLNMCVLHTAFENNFSLIWPSTWIVRLTCMLRLARKWGAHLKPEGITVVLLHPGQ